MDAMQKSIEQLQAFFAQRMDAYQSELQAVSPSVTVTNLAAEFSSFRGFIMSALSCIQDQLRLLIQQQDNMEMRSRRKILLLHGLAESKDEVTTSAVVKAVATTMKVTSFTLEDISRCHRMGRLSSPDKPRPILIKLRNLEVKNKIWFAKASLKGSGLTLSEFLTKTRHDAFMEARQKFGIHKCWSKDGFVFVLDADGTRHRVSCISELEKINVAEMQKPGPSTAKQPAAAPKARRTAVRK